MMAEDYQSNLDELIRHNTNLVRTAQTLQAHLQAAVRICGQVVDSAEPVAGELHGEPLEYLVPENRGQTQFSDMSKCCNSVFIENSGLSPIFRHNINLVRTAQTLQAHLQAAIRICGQVVDCAEPVAGELHGEPLEYLVPAEEIEELRAVCILAKTWGMVDL